MAWCPTSKRTGRHPMSRVRARVRDRRVVRLIHRFLTAGVFTLEKVEPTVEGTRQGSPLSPLAWILRLRRSNLTAVRSGQVDPASTTLLPLEAIGVGGVTGNCGNGAYPGIWLGIPPSQLTGRGAESEPGTRDRTAYAVLRGARAPEPGEGMTRLLNPPNGRVRDPRVRWCGRGGARPLPIPTRPT
jgi:hypothetical protein